MNAGLTYEEGYAQGAQACAQGLPRAPALDASATLALLGGSITGRPVGAAEPFLQGWLAGWDEANLADREEDDA